jgi:hypothetical protein
MLPLRSLIVPPPPSIRTCIKAVFIYWRDCKSNKSNQRVKKSAKQGGRLPIQIHRDPKSSHRKTDNTAKKQSLNWLSDSEALTAFLAERLPVRTDALITAFS